MSQYRPSSFPAHKSNRGGFTLVELLVVIGIIAILAGVALGPITNGIETAKESAAMQTARTVGLSEFQYSVDNSSSGGSYPDGAASVDIVKLLISGKYIQDPGVFCLGSPQTKFAGATAATAIQAGNISWDFIGLNGTAVPSQVGINSSAPDQLPLVWSTGNTFVIPTAASAADTPATTGPSNPFNTHGIPVCYKSNSAKFQKVTAQPNTVVHFIDASFDPGGVTYQVRATGN